MIILLSSDTTVYSYLDKNDAVTPDDLKTSLQASYTPSPNVIDLLEVWDIKQWLGECIEDIHYHTRPHHFRFKLVGNEVEMRYKYWSDDLKWRPECDSENEQEEDEDEIINILKEDCSPASTTPLVCPDLNSLNLDQLLVDLSRLPEDYLPSGKKSEWEEFVSKLKSSSVRGHATKQLPGLHSTRARTQPSSSQSLVDLPTSIQRLLDKENETPPVS